jgi:ferrous iron transport protein A
MFSQPFRSATEIEASSSTLAEARPGEIYRITGIAHWGSREQLMRMGLVEGSLVHCITAFGHGPVAVRCGRTNIAIGWGLARQIKVERVESSVGRSPGGRGGRWLHGFAHRYRHRFGRKRR